MQIYYKGIPIILLSLTISRRRPFNLFSVTYLDLTAANILCVGRKQRDNSKMDNNNGSDCSGSDDSGYSHRAVTNKCDEEKILKYYKILQQRESLMREGILRKCSLLNALKQKYEQVQR